MDRHCLTFSDPDVILLTLQAWNCFINWYERNHNYNNIIANFLIFSVEVECLGPLLGQIIVALSPVVPKHPQVVAEIFKFLIIDNK